VEGGGHRINKVSLSGLVSIGGGLCLITIHTFLKEDTLRQLSLSDCEQRKRYP
jgi:hypothetical protein